MKSLLRICALIKKELLANLKDPRSLASLLVPPIIQCIIFGYAATYDLHDVPYAALDHDRSATSRSFLAHFDGSNTFRRIHDPQSVSEIRDIIDHRRAVFVLTIPENFEKRLFAGEAAPVQFIGDGRNSNTSGIALAYANAATAAFNAGHAGTAPSGPTAAIVLNRRSWYNPNMETRWNMIPALIAALTMLQTLLLAAMSVAREREEGTLDQLLVTPFRPFEIMVGKTVPAMLIGLVQATNVFLVAQLWFRIPFAGSLFTLYAGLILFLFASVGIGLFLSSISKTMQQAMMYTFVVVMPFMLLSGLTTPVSDMPAVVRSLTIINPLRYAIEITQRVYLEGTGPQHLLAEFGVLSLIAAITLVCAAFFFRSKLQ